MDNLKVAAVFLTRLPLRLDGPVPSDALARAVAAFPVVGAFVGLIGAGCYGLAFLLNLPSFPAAVVALAAMVGATGALHEDGLADTADGFGGGRDAADKLRIMRDSRIGSFGVVALVLSLLLRVTVIGSLWDPTLVAAVLVSVGAASRAAMPALMVALRPARADGLGALSGRPEGGQVLLGLALAVGLTLVLLDDATALAALAGGGLAAAAVGLLARRQIGGYTGDVLGAAQQAAEVFFLLGLMAAR